MLIRGSNNDMSIFNKKSNSLIFARIVNKIANYKNNLFYLILFLSNQLVYATELTGVDGIDDMVGSGQKILMVAAKWGGITTVVGAALALGRGRLEGALAQTICKILVVIGLLIAAFGFFKQKLTFGFAF